MNLRAPYASPHRLPTLLAELDSTSCDLEAVLPAPPHPKSARQNGGRGEAAALRPAASRDAGAQRLVYRGSWDVELAPGDFKPVRSRWSPEMYALLGFEPHDVEATPELFLSVVPPEEREKVLKGLADCVHQGGKYIVEHRIIRPDGVERVVLERAQLILDESGANPIILRGTCEDITARSYQRSTKKYVQLLDNIQAGVIVHRGDGTIETFNRAACEILGVDSATLRQRGATASDWTFYRPDGTVLPAPEFPANVAIARRSCVRGQIVGVVTGTGNMKWVQANAEPMLDDAGAQVAEVVVTFMDISEQVRARNLVDEGARFVRNVLDSVHHSVAVLDRNGTIKFVNESWRHFARANGATDAAAFTGTNYLDVCARAARSGAPDATSTLEGLQNVLRGAATHFEWEYPCHAPTEQRWFLLRASPLGAPYDGAVVAHIDVTERRKAQIACNERDRQVSQLIANLPGFVYRCLNTPDRPIVFISDGVMGVLGYSPKAFGPRNVNFAQLILPEEAADVRAAIQRALERNERYDVEYRVRHADGQVRWVWDRGVGVLDPANGSLLHLEGIISDISERKQLEEQFRQAQKMDVLGQLAGGVAHDFNNLITVIKGHVGLLESTSNLPEPVLHSLDQIAAASDRATNLTRQLLAFSRKDVMSARILDLGACVREMTKMLRRMVGENYEITLDLPPAPLHAKGDGGMIDQVLMNLVVNARDAMPGGGRIAVALNSVSIGETALPQQPGRRPGEFAQLVVRDRGEGIQPDILPRIFEPFFTTKPETKGTGLGLATVFNIVRQHQGWIEVDSTVGQGTEFRVFLPTFGEGAVALSQPARLTPGGSETILVVEDDENVRLVLQSVLQRKGYRVISAKSAPNAYQLWVENKGDFDLLITDLVLPEGMNGPDLQRVLQAERPELPWIVISGYVPDPLSRGLGLKEGENFLAKPFSAENLLATVRSRLDRNPTR